MWPIPGELKKNLNPPWEATFELLATQEHQFSLAGKSKPEATFFIFAIDYFWESFIRDVKHFDSECFAFLDNT